MYMLIHTYMCACMCEYECALVCEIHCLLYEERIDKASRDRCFLQHAQLNSLMKKLYDIRFYLNK